MVINGDIKLNNEDSYVNRNNMPLDGKMIYPKNKCILCGKSCDDRLLCKDCFIKYIRVEQSLCFDNIDALLTVYCKTKKECYLINDIVKVIDNCITLLAVARYPYVKFNEYTIYNTSKRDILKIRNAIKSRVNIPNDKHIVTIDGLTVLSEGEHIVDDILYNNRLLHCYNKDVIQLGVNNRIIISDWFIPIINNKGIYIEYFGMLTDEYILNKKDKISLYKKYNIPLIIIE